MMREFIIQLPVRVQPPTMTTTIESNDGFEVDMCDEQPEDELVESSLVECIWGLDFLEILEFTNDRNKKCTRLKSRLC